VPSSLKPTVALHAVNERLHIVLYGIPHPSFKDGIKTHTNTQRSCKSTFKLIPLIISSWRWKTRNRIRGPEQETEGRKTHLLKTRSN
jgi:hypothetical protein